jgi:hypothetical protein
MGTSLKLVAGVGVDEVAPAAGDAVGDCATDVEDCATDVGDAAWAVADELEACEPHPAMRTPATARPAPVSNVRRAAIVFIFLNPLSTSTVHAKHGSPQARQ